MPADFIPPRVCILICEIILTLPISMTFRQEIQREGGFCVVQCQQSRHGEADPLQEGVKRARFQHKAGSRTRGIGYEAERSPTLTSEQLAAVYDARGNGDGKTACTLTGDHQSRVTDYTAIVMATGQAGAEIMRDACPTLNCNHEQSIVAHTLRGSGRDPQREDAATYPVTDGMVRRLTPLECERLQGFPDGWTDIGPWTDSAGKLHKESSDSARYKALGNSIALPPWAWVLSRRT